MKLPIGLSNFKEMLTDNYTFVDKSLFIKDIIDDSAKVILLTRPRRFGKTLNMSMLQQFLDITEQSDNNIFSRLLISQAGDEYLKHQNQYPVIFLSFKDIKENNFESTRNKFVIQLAKLYEQYRFLLSSDHLSETEKSIYHAILKREADLEDVQYSLKNLSEYLSRYYKKNTVILIDEYDSPIHASYLNHHYQETISFMRGIFSGVLKDNNHLQKAVLTGILRIAKEDLFSGVNNLKVYSMMHARYGEYFGFTETEVAHLVNQFGLKTQIAEIRDWYNGYKIGETVIYNPWSIINCLDEKGSLQPYWINTSDNQLIKKLLKQSGDTFQEHFEKLLEGKSVKRLIDENTVFADMFDNSAPAATWSLLFMSGYLKIIEKENTDQGVLCTLTIPNREVRNLYRKIVEQSLSDGYGIEWYNQFLEYLLSGDLINFEQNLKQILEHNVSAHDISKDNEAFYHTFMLGLTASLHGNKNYIRTSNLESGYGRYDYMIYAKDPNRPSILMEFKRLDDEKKKTGTLEDLLIALEKLAQEAVQQINEKKYVAEAEKLGCKEIIKMGLAFCGKRFKLYSEREIISR